MSAPSELLLGLILGFSLTLPPGPMNALIAAQSVRSYWRGFATGLGAMSADAVLGAAVYLLSTLLPLTPYLREIYALGAVVMAGLAYRILSTSPAAAPPPTALARDYSAALLVGISNPFQIVWWLTAGLGFAYLGGSVLFAGLFGAIAVWILAFPYGISAGARRYPSFSRVLTYVSGALMIAFGIYFVVLAL